MRALIAAAALAPVLALGQASLKVSNATGQICWATVSQRLTAEGAKSVELRVQIGTGSTQIKIHRQATYASDGAPTRIFQEEVREGGKTRRQVIVNFTIDGAQVTEDRSGVRTVKKVPLVGSASPRAKSEYWFLRDQPAPGAIQRFYSFDLNTFEWKLTEVTYRGRENKLVGNQVKRLHKVETSIEDRLSTAWLDDQGLPVTIDDGTGLKFDR